MDPAHSPSGPGRVPADAAGAGQAGLCIGGQLLHRDALHPDVGSAPIQMLAVGGPAHGFVVGSGAVAAGDVYRLAEVLPDSLQQHYQLVVEEDDIAALAGKLPHLEAG